MIIVYIPQIHGDIHHVCKYNILVRIVAPCLEQTHDRVHETNTYYRVMYMEREE